MGKRKIDNKKLEIKETATKWLTCSKRTRGILKKVMELSQMCD